MATVPDGRSSAITRHTPVAELPEYLRPDEVGAWLDLGRSALYELLRRGDIPSIRLGRLIRVSKSSLLELKAGR